MRGAGAAAQAGEPARREGAAGAIAGLLAGLGMAALAWGLGAAGLAPGAPLRLLASTLLGAGALDPEGAAAAWLGAALAALGAGVAGLVFASLVPEEAGLARSAAAGVAWGLATFLGAWLLVARIGAPLLLEAGRPHALAVAGLHAAFGAMLGLLLPVLRSALD